jgi:hypothetical protein
MKKTAFRILSILFVLIFCLVFEKKRATGDDRSQKENIVFGVVFNDKEDPQRKDMSVQNTFQYLKRFLQSVLKHKNMRAVLLGSAFDSTVLKKIKTYDHWHAVEIEAIDWKNDTFLRQFENHSIYHWKFFLAEYWITKNLKNLDYVLISDIGDVEFLRDPFDFMKGLDMIIGRNEIYVGSEERACPGGFGSYEWMRTTWRRCTGTDYNLYDFTHLFNAGLLGGKASHLLEFLRILNSYIRQSIDPEYCCDLIFLNLVIKERFNEKVITGYPFNSAFKKKFNMATDSYTYINHKSFYN